MSAKITLKNNLYNDLKNLFTTSNPTDPDLKLNLFCEKLSNDIDIYVRTMLTTSSVNSNVTIPSTSNAGSPSFGTATGTITPPT